VQRKPKSPTQETLQINLIDPSHAHTMGAALLAAREPNTGLEAVGAQAFAWAGSQARIDESRAYPVINGTAFIPIRGVLLNGFYGQWGSYATGYQWIQKHFVDAMDDPSIDQVAFVIDSPGGHATGCSEVASVIRSMRDQKPTFALVEGMMASAAFFIGSAMGTIVATTTTEVGSIGTIMTHMSYEAAMDTYGIEVTHIYKGAHKVDGSPYKNLTEQARARYDAHAQTHYDLFVQGVAAGRGDKLNEQAARDTEANMFLGAEALDKGLIDVLVTSSTGFAPVIMPNKKGTFMSGPAAQEGDIVTVATAPVVDASAIVQAERTRIAAIMQLPQAKSQPALAEHFAYNTAMSVEDATKALATVVVEAPAPVVDAKEPDLLTAAMDKTDNKDPGADRPVVAASRAQRVLALRFSEKGS
jgi:signal peptide peptidase SppA